MLRSRTLRRLGIFAPLAALSTLLGCSAEPDEFDLSEETAEQSDALVATLTHRWQLDEAGGTAALDSVGGVQGTLGGTATRVPGLVGSGAVNLPGTSSASTINFTTAVGQFGVSDFSATYWIRTSKSGASELLTNRNNASAGNYFSMRIANIGIAAEMYQNTSGLNASVAQINGAFNDGQWHFLAVTRQGTKTVLYVDGQSASATSAAPTHVANGVPLTFGNNPIAGAFGTRYVGAVDDIRLYGRALSACEVQAIRAGNEADGDGDGAVDPCDDCPAVANPDQADADDDGTGDACEPAPNGAVCAASAECASGACVDGVCCDTACGGGDTLDCQACSVAAGAAQDGVCGPTSGNACDDDSACTTHDVCTQGACAGSAELVANGGFEQPVVAPGSVVMPASIPGWTLAFGSAIEVQRSVDGDPAEGNQHVELDAFESTGIYQDITTIPGAKYTLSFAFSPRPGFNAGDNVLGVRWNGQLVDTLTASGTFQWNTAWTQHTYTLTATSGTTRLQLEDLGTSNGVGTYLDDVHLTLLDTDDDSIADACDNCASTANTSQSDADADGVGDVCEPMLPENGAPCATSADCASGVCADGVCCETVCGGGDPNDCQACSVALGAAVDGVCGPTTGNTCNDGDASTALDTCHSGVCQGITPIACTYPLPPASPLVNGSFEQNATAPGAAFTPLYAGSAEITGWTIEAPIDYIGTYYQAAGGGRSLDMNAHSYNLPGRISQTLATIPGKTYLVSFMLAGNPVGPPVTKTLEVSAAGKTQGYAFNVTGKTRANMGWVPETFSFVAISTTTKLTFASLIKTSFGPALDAITVSECSATAPETCVTIQRGTNGSVDDAQIADDPTKMGKNYGANTTMIAGDVNGSQRRALLRFDLGILPANATITSATATLVRTNVYGAGQTIEVHPATAPWTESGVTWSSFGGAYAPAVLESFVTDSGAGPVSFDLTSEVQGWYSGAATNDGVVLLQSGAMRYTNFATGEDPSVASRPKLDVCYQLP